MKIKDSKWRASRKTLPKTLSESFPADCGHTFQHRIALGQLGGKEASEENWAKVEKIVEREKTLRTLSECPECTAKVNLESCRATERILFKFLSLEPLAPLDGTTRQLAYAESVRQTFVVEPLRVLQRSITTSENDVLFKFLLQSVEKLGEAHGVPSLSGDARYSFSEDLENMRKDFERVQMEQVLHPIKDPETILAFWLASRKFWAEELKFIGWHDRAKTWIARSSRRSRVYHMHTVSSAQRYIEDSWSDLNAAMFVSKIASWDDRSQAETAYKFLTTEDTVESNIKILMQVLENNSCSSWNEVFDLAAVWKTLT